MSLKIFLKMQKYKMKKSIMIHLILKNQSIDFEISFNFKKSDQLEGGRKNIFSNKNVFKKDV